MKELCSIVGITVQLCNSSVARCASPMRDRVSVSLHAARLNFCFLRGLCLKVCLCMLSCPNSKLHRASNHQGAQCTQYFQRLTLNTRCCAWRVMFLTAIDWQECNNLLPMHSTHNTTSSTCNLSFKTNFLGKRWSKSCVNFVVTCKSFVVAVEVCSCLAATLLTGTANMNVWEK